MLHHGPNEYEAAVKAACKEAANNIIQNGVSFHSAGKYVVSSLAERGISLGRTQAIKRVKEVVAAGGQSPKIPVPFTRNALWKLREANEVDKNRRSMGVIQPAIRREWRCRQHQCLLDLAGKQWPTIHCTLRRLRADQGAIRYCLGSSRGCAGCFVCCPDYARSFL